MRIEHGRMVYENRACYSCQGAGTRDYNVLCPLWNKPVSRLPGHRCPHCGTKNRHSHKTVGTEIRTCDSCRGVGSPMETAYDTVPKEILDSLPFKVYRTSAVQTWAQEYLGIGSLVSVTDYGRHRDLSDDDLIAKVRDALFATQAISGVVSRADHGRLCDHLGIVTNSGGYEVKGIFLS